MTTLKLKSNILGLICRTCLKMNKIRFNIFEHLQNDKLIATMLMECLPIRINENYELPANICSNCLEKLCSACDFKTMAMQSDAKLHNFYQNKILENEKDRQNVNSVYIKEETMLKSEQTDSLSDLCDDNGITQDNIIEKQNLNNDVDHNTVDLLAEQCKSQNVCVLNNKPSIQYQNQDIRHVLSLNNNKEEISDTDDSSYKNTDQAEHIVSDNTAKKHGSSATSKFENVESSRIANNEGEMLMEYESPNELNNSTDDSDQSSVCSDSSGESENKSSKRSKLKKKEKRNKRGNQVNCNEQQAELLDNPDYKRIISSGLSKKEKDRATVFCKECRKTLTFRYFVSVHAYTHTGAPSFKCQKCSKCFPREYILKQHMRIHSETKDFSCDVCGKSFTTQLSAQLHKTKHSDERPHACNICGKTFKYTAALRHHLKIHNDDKNFVCELCGKSFLNNGGLARHKETHNTEKNFVCTICGKSFKSRANLKDHTKRHSDDKRYSCTYCDKRFKGHEVLKNHILIHTGEKPFTCSVCDKKFRQRPSLRYHMRTHTGETPYECDTCRSKFRYKHHLLNHMKVHGSELPQKQDISTSCLPPVT